MQWECDDENWWEKGVGTENLKGMGGTNVDVWNG